ncbi:hypothetical protein ACEQ8A_002812 [Vibrio fluvialis]|nr:hypothetical protein [Vibrio fluvialis]ELS3716452.1 hypothetical protein [Vibrio fluvialis]ELX9693149.1 hypothetical protein [Vibrio fluvialis]
MIDFSCLDKFVTVNSESFVKKFSGVQVVENKEYIEICCDPFSSVPVFFAQKYDGSLVLFSNFEDIYNVEDVSFEVDVAGFWEVVIFGSGVWDRTLYKSIKQLPSASKLIFNKETEEFFIEKYYTFNVQEDSSIDSLDKAAELVFNKLDDIFSKLNRNEKYVMGMSGGMDSRIALAFLSRHIPRDKLELFTYGFDDSILEYSYAKDCAKALGYKEPVFHKLSSQSYRTALDYLPKMSGGQIGVHHCHITDYLCSRKDSDFKYISTYYSDAVMGWEAKECKNIDFSKKNYYEEMLDRIDYISDDIKQIIVSDSKKVFSYLNENSNYSSMDEYKYVTERNVKFHVYLSSIQSRLISDDNCSLILPFADLELLELMLSIPLKFRKNKLMIDAVIDKYFPELSQRSIGNVSSRFQWGKGYASSYDFYKFKLINGINAVLRKFTQGKVQVLNDFQTEELDRVLFSDFYSDLITNTKYLESIGVMDRLQVELWCKLPLRSVGICERFSIISVGHLLNNKNE